MGACLGCCRKNASDNGNEENNVTRHRPNRQYQGHDQLELDNSETIQSGTNAFPFQYALGQKYAGSNERRGLSEGHHGRGQLDKISVPWNTPIPITREELTRKRNEFWETVPAYGGCIEVWQTLEQAVQLGYEGDMETLRAMLSCAGITTPTGTLTEAYDFKGFRYSIPAYCLCDPTNGLVSDIELDSKSMNNEISALETPITADPTIPFKLHTSRGEKINIDIPNRKEFCLGHLRVMLREKLECGEERIEFFLAGHGPLPDSTNVLTLPQLVQGYLEVVILQAWIFSSPHK